MTVEQSRDAQIVLPVREGVAALWAADPLLASFLDEQRRRLDGTREGEMVRTPREAVGIQRQNALLLVRSPEVALDHISDRIERLAVAAEYAGFLWNSPTVYWPRGMLKLAMGLPLPRHIISPDVCPWEAATFVLQRSWGMHAEGEEAGFWAVHVVYLRREAGYLHVAYIAIDPQGRPGIRYRDLRFGSRYPEETPGADANILAALAFINSPFVRLERRSVAPGSKAARRRVAWTSDDEPDVHVIRLRAEAEQSIRRVENFRPDHTFSHRWIVRGHYRAQWYPTAKSHRLIWIAPYIKGPDDTPLKMPVYAVVR